MARKILLVLGKLGQGGLEKVVKDLIYHGDRERFDFFLCEMSMPSDQVVQQSVNCPVYSCPIRPVHTYFQRFWSLLSAHDFDVVHIHRTSYVSALPLLISRLYGVKSRLLHLHNVYRNNRHVNRLIDKILRLIILSTATKVMGVSNHVLDTHFQDKWRASPRFDSVYNAIDLSTWHNPGMDVLNELRGRLGISKGEVVIGNHARFSEAKNHKAFLQLASYLRMRNCTEFKILLIGDGDLRPAIEAQVRAMGLSQHFIFTGWSDNISQLLYLIDIYFFPSFWEGMPLSLLEAFAAGLPLVCARIPAVMEYLPPILKELTFDNSNPDVGFRHVERLILNPEERLALQEPALHVGKQHQMDIFIRKVQDCYEQ